MPARSCAREPCAESIPSKSPRSATSDVRGGAQVRSPLANPASASQPRTHHRYRTGGKPRSRAVVMPPTNDESPRRPVRTACSPSSKEKGAPRPAICLWSETTNIGFTRMKLTWVAGPVTKAVVGSPGRLAVLRPIYDRCSAQVRAARTCSATAPTSCSTSDSHTRRTIHPAALSASS